MNTNVILVIQPQKEVSFLTRSFQKKALLLFFLVFSFMFDLNAQIQKCYTWEAEQELRAQYPQLGTKADFEAWMRKTVKSAVQFRDVTDVTIVPIIFHIIHDGENIGTGDNISANFVTAQIEQLNNDFGKIDGTSGDNEEEVGASTDIRFCPALTNPNGDLLPESGINRIDRNDMGWVAPPYSGVTINSYIEATIKPMSQWNPEQYLNVWVCRGAGGLLGYATWPIQSGLTGVPLPVVANRDGVMIIPSSVGSTESPFPSGGAYNQGRTLTHELGHFFGLRHIWGDGGCGVDDFCGDTPNSDGSNFGCPTSHQSCGTTDMVRNYMDYTDDICMNIFTMDQRTRMDAVRRNSPRRMFDQVACNNQGCGVLANSHVSENTIWEEESTPLGVSFMGTIFVHSGATLTINTPISFGPGGGIYIYDGGKVILNSTLTSCDRWNGVRVFGGAEFRSNPGSVIEHAVWGISSTEWGVFLGTAKIDCNGTTFRNNGVAAMIATKNGIELEKQAYYANFSNCEFITNNEMRHEKFWAFITSYNVKGVAEYLPAVFVFECNFIDLQTNSTYSNKWNSGIVALNGDLGVYHSTFRSLYSGIEARAGLTDNPWLRLNECKFFDCGYGVLNSGITGSYFRNNTFGFVNQTEGVSVILQDQMNDTYFQGNVFKRTQVGSDPSKYGSIGLYINSIGASKTNKIRKNSYTNIDYANIARGNNANFVNGLHYLCNTNSHNSAFDFLEFSGYAMRDEQGLASVNNIFLPSGNTFSHLSWDFGNFGQNIANYYYTKGNDSQTPGGNSGNNGNYDGIVLQPKIASNHCDFRRERRALTTVQEAMDNEQDYSRNNSSHQIALQDYNNAKNSGNTDLIKSKKASLTFESDRLGQTVALGYNYARKQPNNRTETRMWIRRFNNVAGDYLLVGDYFGNGEYQQGLAVLTEMAWKRQLTEKEMIDLDKVEHIYQTIAEDGLDNLNPSFLTDLESYAASKEGKSCFLARTILRNDGQYYAPITDIPAQFRKDEDITGKMAESIKMLVSPNPADYHVTFDWTAFNTMGKEVRIEISNQMGMLVDILRPNMGSTSQNWTTDKVSGSSCHYGLFIDGQEADSGQIIINK